MIFSISLMQNLAKKAQSPQDIVDALKERGITYLLVNYELFNIWAQKYSVHEKQMLKSFFDNLTITEFSKDSHGLLMVVSGT